MLKVLVVYSGKKDISSAKKIPREFALKFDGQYASRFLRHLYDDETLCTGCGKKCNKCRLDYDLDFSGQIRQIQLPEIMPYFVDNINEYLPRSTPGVEQSNNLPSHDVLIAINVHEDILIALIPLAKKAGIKTFILPIEDPGWITNWGRSRLKKLCKENDIEFSSPKPFCSLEKGVGPVTDKFIDEFKIGRPKLKIKVKNGVIEEATVLVCAPCGNTYYVAKNIVGKKVDKHLNEWIAKYWHSYPCVASMKMDSELGDTILHKGGYIHYDAVREALP